MFTKKTFRYFLCILMINPLANTFAATAVELIVKSVVIPTGCTVEFSNSVLDYGNIPAATLSPTTETELKSLSTTFTITCNAATKIQYRLEDNRKASLPISTTKDNSLYGLGIQKSSRGEKIGYYSIYIDPNTTTGNGMPASSIYNVLGGTLRRGWSHSTTGMTLSDKEYFMSFAEFGTYVPTAFTTFSGVVTVTPKIMPGNTLDLSRKIDLDGSVTLEIVYL